MEHLYIVIYDISNQRRWRKVFKTLQGYGAWLQLSVFQCRLNKMRYLQLEAAVNELVNHAEDHILFLDLGPAENVTPKVKSIGKKFVPVAHELVVV